MTATAGRAPAADAGARWVPLLLLGEVALVAVTLAGVLGLRRVFLGTEWFGTLALHVMAAHATAALLRRRGVGMLAATGLMVAVGATLITWSFAGDHTAYGVPTATAFDVLGTQIGDALAAWSEVKAPTDALDGFLVATAIAIWAGAILADWSAFRVDAPLESTLPSASLFVLGAVLGADVDRILLAGLWVAATMLFVLLRRADRLGHTATWVGERRATGPRTLVVLGVGLALVSVAVAALVGPRLPGARSEAIVSLRDIGDTGPGTRVTVSPLVDIRSRLVDQANVEVFSVRSPVRSYWRLTSLETFDGRIWKSNGSYGKADGDLDDGVPVASPQVPFEQSYSIAALSQIWLPAAYEPQHVTVAQDVRYDEVSGTLIVDTDVPTSDDLTYQVTSALPEHDPASLAAASTQLPPSLAGPYLDLPSDFPESVRAVAREIAAGSTSAYEASLRLQNHFRENFTYDLEVGPGHGESAIEQFVLESRRGYCEQFAGSFAAMARSLGIPARVAVGFTPGDVSPDDPTLYRVSGRHAHAWPEVFLGEYGWVAFEPTPGRGAPFAEQYTGVPEQQVTSGGDPTTATTTVSPPSTEAGAGQAPPPSRPSPENIESPVGDEIDPVEEREQAWRQWFVRIALAAAALLAAVVLYVVAVVATSAWRRHRRRRAAVDADAQVALAWEESLGAVRRAGVRVRSAQTQSEVADRVGARLPSVDDPMRTLAITVERVTYSPVSADPDVGSQALVLAAEIERAAEATMSRSDRIRSRFHPRRLLGRD